MLDLLFLSAAGLIGGGMNALVGGGSFITLPALIAAGVPPVEANASSTVALYPGGLASAWTYHERLKTVCGIGMRPLLAVTLIGGFAGSCLLLWTPGTAFTFILPWLLLLATLALAFGRRIAEGLWGRMRVHPAPVLLMQFALGLYGGYFGGAVGVMMVAAWSVFGESSIKALNGPRTLMVSVANTIAVATFVLAHAVWWPQTLAMLAGGLLGGYAGALLGRVVPPRVTRALTLCCTTGITAAFFVKTYVLKP